MQGFFIDKLNVVQNHLNDDGQTLPLVGREKLFRVDLETGVSTELVTHLQLEGSYSSSVIVRSDGNKVECYGNPSRWGRIDNLFGYTTIQECIDVYNVILVSLGLPIFTKCTKYIYLTGKDGKPAPKSADGAVIKHIDWTRNLFVGQGNERPFLKGLSTQSIGRSVSPFLYPNENTVEWFGKTAQKNGSTYRYVKCYTKTADLLRHQKKNTINQSISDQDYYQKLIEFSATTGIVREEHSFKRPFLLKYNLFAFGLFDESEFTIHLSCLDEIRQRLEVSNMKYETIAQQLLDQGICPNRQSANSTQCYYSMWLHGEYIDKDSRQYYRHKKRLLQLGIDISQKLDISRAPIRLKEAQIIECGVLTAPDWYKMPVKPEHVSKPVLTPKFRLVA
ncbi:MAG TPA: hypothetical protein DGG95_03225 [Cytophagales bacterium]|jgi:hypothetical protein|nr:hypothetical protein [Cytophagales bacterium]